MIPDPRRTDVSKGMSQTGQSPRLSSGNRRHVEVAVVEGNTLLRDALCRILDEMPGYSILWSAKNGPEAAGKLQTTPPHLLITAFDLPENGAFELMRLCKVRTCKSQMILIVDCVTPAILQVARSLKVSAIASRQNSLDSLMDLLQQVAAAPTSKLIIDEKTQVSDQEEASADGQVRSLSGRQLEVLRHIAAGGRVKEIAATLQITPKAVESHKYRIMKTLGVNDRVQLTLFAIRAGLVEA